MSTNWFWNLVIALFTLSTISYFGGGDGENQQRVGVAYLFLLFLLILFIDVVFIALYVPETKPSLVETKPVSKGSSSTDIVSMEGREHQNEFNIELEMKEGDVVRFVEEGLVEIEGVPARL